MLRSGVLEAESDRLTMPSPSGAWALWPAGPAAQEGPSSVTDHRLPGVAPLGPSSLGTA